jgi:hypothetical protein
MFMVIELTAQDVMTIYKKIKVELIQLEMLHAVHPNPMADEPYLDEMNLYRSVINKIETVCPMFLDEICQTTLRNKAMQKLVKS